MNEEEFVRKHGEQALASLHERNSDTALQAAIELMLTTQPPARVIAKLESFAQYLRDY